MATFLQELSDVRYVVQLASGTVYYGGLAALAAGIAISAANSNAPVLGAKVMQQTTASGVNTPAKVDMPGGATPLWILVQLPGTTYLGLEAVYQAALALSAANGSAPVYVARGQITGVAYP